MPVTRLSTADAIRSIIHLLVRAVAKAPSSSSAALVRIDRLPTTPDEEVRLAVRPLESGLHPMAVLDGFVAPPAWAGMGVIAAGRLVPMEGPDGDRGRGRVVLALARDGTLGTALCLPDGSAHVRVGLASAGAPWVIGELPLALCRALGVPFAGSGGTSGDP